jgi:tetratricopeptide (TPR) repeat protein
MSLPEINPGQLTPASAPAIVVHRRRRLQWMALVGVICIGFGGWVGGRHLWARHHFHSAEQAAQRTDFSQALDDYEKALKVWPDDIDVRFKAARVARRAGLFARAQEHYDEYKKRRGATRELLLEWAMWHAQQGDLSEVEQPLQQAVIEGHPNAILILEALAQGYLTIYRIGFAIASIQMILEHDPDHADARFWRGGILEGAGRSTEALEDYKRAVELIPTRIAYRLRFAEALLRNNRAQEARPHFEELLLHNAADPKVLLGAGRCFHALTLPAEAKKYLDSLLRQDPENADGWAELGRIALDENNTPEAVNCLRRAVELEPRSYPIGYALLTVLKAEGQTEEANALSVRLEQLKRDEERLKEINKQLSKTLNNPALRHEAALICQRNKVEEEAIRWFLGALQDDPNYQPTHAALAELYRNKGDVQQADYHSERAK